MESGRYFLIILLLSLLGVFAYDRGWITSSPVDKSGEKSSQPNVSQKLSDFTLNETIGEQEIWRIQSPSASKSGDQIRLQSPTIVQSLEGDSKAIVKSDNGVYKLDKKIIVLTNNVVLKRPQKSQTLMTDKLKWNRSEQRVTTDELVKLEFPRGILRATGMRMNLKEDTVKFLSNVRYTSH